MHPFNPFLMSMVSCRLGTMRDTKQISSLTPVLKDLMSRLGKGDTYGLNKRWKIKQLWKDHQRWFQKLKGTLPWQSRYSALSLLLTTMYLCLAWCLAGSAVMDEWLISILQMSKLRFCLPQWLSGKESAYNAGEAVDSGLIPGSGRSPGGGNGNPLQYSCLGNSMDRGAWWATVPGVTQSWIWLKQLSMHANRFRDTNWLIWGSTHSVSGELGSIEPRSAG